jgi:hypothetical protein
MQYIVIHHVEGGVDGYILKGDKVLEFGPGYDGVLKWVASGSVSKKSLERVRFPQRREFPSYSEFVVYLAEKTAEDLEDDMDGVYLELLRNAG